MSAAPKVRGRPRIYLDDAERAAAHRERVADAVATGEMLRVIFDRPTPDLIRNLATKFAARREDKAQAGEQLIKALLEGLAAGGGENCAEAAANYVRYEFRRPSEQDAT